MPSPADILNGLTRIANDAFALAVIWHVAAAVAIAALLAGWVPTRRAAALLLTLPLMSVAALAVAYGNPFNAIVIALAAASLLAMGWNLGNAPVVRHGGWTTAAGIAVIAFGWVYPHFLEGHSPLVYLFAAPTGLLPCPTLSLVVGFALIGGGLESRLWSSALAATGILYGAFGALRLDVWLDIVLLVAACALVALAWSRKHTSHTTGLTPA